MKASCLLFIALSFALTLPAQDMQEGFSFLENGQFIRAKDYFTEILKEHPSNKTALICLGRATGLSGDPEKALIIFDELLMNDPNDLEVQLNKAEAFLWKKDPKSAIVRYQEILTENPVLFAALLGIANSYSMIGKYREGHTYIKEALQVDPMNPQTLLSAKYIRLGYANNLASEHQEYAAAISLVHENLENDNNDQESLGLLANIFLISRKYDSAITTYARMSNPINALLGRSTSQHLAGKNEDALVLAEKACNIPDHLLNGTDQTRRSTHLLSALLWNNKISQARLLIDSLSLRFPTNPAFIACQAEVAMYEADFDRGIANYTTFLALDSSSFKGNLGRADAFHALGLDNKSYEYAFQTLKFYPGQKDVVGFIDRLNQQHSPRLSTAYEIGVVSDGSSFNLWNLSGFASLKPTVTITAALTEKGFQTSNEDTGTKSKTATIASSVQINRSLKVEGSYGQLKIFQKEVPTQTRSDVDFALHYRLNKNQKLTLAYQTEIQDFNAQLLSRNLKTTHLAVQNSMFWKVKGLGSYTELFKSFLSDGNGRNLLFTSLYKNLKNPENLKLGFNYLTMAFEKQVPLSYFSPENYHQLEVFSSYKYIGKKVPFTVSLDLAGGLQSLDQKLQTTWRTKIMLQKEVGRLAFELAGAYSSISTTQANGFSIKQVSGKISWRITNSPLFKKALGSSLD